MHRVTKYKKNLSVCRNYLSSLSPTLAFTTTTTALSFSYLTFMMLVKRGKKFTLLHFNSCYFAKIFGQTHKWPTIYTYVTFIDLLSSAPPFFSGLATNQLLQHQPSLIFISIDSEIYRGWHHQQMNSSVIQCGKISCPNTESQHRSTCPAGLLRHSVRWRWWVSSRTMATFRPSHAARSASPAE